MSPVDAERGAILECMTNHISGPDLPAVTARVIDLARTGDHRAVLVTMTGQPGVLHDRAGVVTPNLDAHGRLDEADLAAQVNAVSFEEPSDTGTYTGGVYVCRGGWVFVPAPDGGYGHEDLAAEPGPYDFDPDPSLWEYVPRVSEEERRDLEGDAGLIEVQCAMESALLELRGFHVRAAGDSDVGSPEQMWWQVQTSAVDAFRKAIDVADRDAMLAALDRAQSEAARIWSETDGRYGPGSYGPFG